MREVALTNAYIVYQNAYKRNKLTPEAFWEAVIDGLLEGFVQSVRSATPRHRDLPIWLNDTVQSSMRRVCIYQNAQFAATDQSLGGSTCRPDGSAKSVDKGCFKIYQAMLGSTSTARTRPDVSFASSQTLLLICISVTVRDIFLLLWFVCVWCFFSYFAFLYIKSSRSNTF